MKKFISVIFILFSAFCAFAQSAEMMDQIIEADKVTYGQISYLSAVHQKLVGDEATEEEALNALLNVKHLSKSVLPETVITLEDLSCLYLKMWPSVKGGFMCRITNKAPRYAYKQLQEDGILPKNSDPWNTVSGFEALNILTKCMMTYVPEEERMTLNDDGMED